MDDILDGKTQPPEITWAMEGEEVLRVSPTAPTQGSKTGRRPTPMPGISGLRKSERSDQPDLGPAGRRAPISAWCNGLATGWTGVHDRGDLSTPPARSNPIRSTAPGCRIILDTLPYAGQACNDSTTATWKVQPKARRKAESV